MLPNVRHIGTVAVLGLAVSCGGSTGLGTRSEEAGAALDSSTKGDATSEGRDAIGGFTDDGPSVDGGTIPSFFDTGANFLVDGPPPSGFFPDAACGPANCPKGCCNGDGFCVAPPSAQFCGGQGNVCTSCGALGQCLGTAGCARPQSNCGPSNCPGCCAGSDCVTGTFGIQCGSAGALCTVCRSDEQCRPLFYDAGGYCQANSTCGPSNCTGCCVGDVCAQGNQNGACGWGGTACALCGSSSTCVTGVCVCGGPQLPGANCGGDAGAD